MKPLIKIATAQTTEIKAESGVTLEKNKVYYKEYYSETRLVLVGADVEKEREALWNTVHDQIDKQIQAILNS